MNYFYTADEHYFHSAIIKWCHRPFDNLYHMHDELVERHNAVVNSDDIIVHVGDFSMGSKQQTLDLLKKLKGTHILIRGSHDKWLGKQLWSKWSIQYVGYLYERKFSKDIHITACHYSMRTWPHSHYGSWHVFGHSHGRLEGFGKSIDVGVDTHDYYPYSLEEIVEIMKDRPQNFNYVLDRHK